METELSFMGCFERYDECRAGYNEALVRLIDARQLIQTIKQRMTAIESEKLVNGEVVGNNEATRKASLVALLAEDARYQREVLALRGAEATQARYEATQADAANGMSQYRRGMDYAIATRNLEAAVKAGLGLERENSHG